MALPDYAFYVTKYHGVSIPNPDFERLAFRAHEQISGFERKFVVSGDESARSMAVCAIADAIYAREVIASQAIAIDENSDRCASSVSIGSVSASYKSPDITAAGVDMTAEGAIREYYRLLRLYMNVYRGAGGRR